jgi:chorismate mutase / prephenate dehydratase
MDGPSLIFFKRLTTMINEKILADVRQKINDIDDQLHDLLVQRTQIAEEVRLLKKNESINLRPAREAQILYRLLNRHKGKFPRRELTRIWREIIVATLRMQGPFSIAVIETDDNAGYSDIARDQYGSFTPMTHHLSSRSVIEAVQKGKATVGILPWPQKGMPDPWWQFILFDSPNTPRIIGRLPFAGPSNSRNNHIEAAVIAPITQEATGRDHSLLALEFRHEMSERQIKELFLSIKLAVQSCIFWRNPDQSGEWIYLIQVSSFIGPKSDIVQQILSTFNNQASRVIQLGGYASPLSIEELETFREAN